MKIRVISDLHIDVNEGFPFSIDKNGRDIYSIIAGDVSGHPKLTERWIKTNIHQGCFVAGNHDPVYNKSGDTIGKQKEYLHKKFGIDSDVTFLDESVGVMSKEIPNTDILVVGSTLYTDYKYTSFEVEDAVKYNMGRAVRRMNDFAWGRIEDESADGKQRHLSPSDYLDWFNKTFARITELVESNKDKEIIVVTHHCPTPLCISEEYVGNDMNASYISDLEGFITSHPNIKAWCCGHVHHCGFFELGDNHTLIVCNPRGYEQEFGCSHWNPNTFIDTDTWKIVTEPYEPTPKLKMAREAAYDRFMSLAGFFF